MKPFSSRFVTLRARRVHYLTWGRDDAPLVIMVHGWMDVAASFQFLVDALQREWRIVAPDLRGFGETEFGRESTSGYWFHDYLADLDALGDLLSPNQPFHLLGHSLGGNIACIYAGVRPHRVRTLVSLDGFGVPDGKASQASEKIIAWLDATRDGASLAPYPTFEAVVARLQKNTPRLSLERARRIADAWSEQVTDENGSYFRLRADPAHKLPFPTVYRLEESLEIWSHISAPTLWLGASDSAIRQWLGYGRDDPAEFGADSQHSAEFQRRLAAIAKLRFDVIADASHMLHHDQPDIVAQKLEAFWDFTEAKQP